MCICDFFFLTGSSMQSVPTYSSVRSNNRQPGSLPVSVALIIAIFIGNGQDIGPMEILRASQIGSGLALS